MNKAHMKELAGSLRLAAACLDENIPDEAESLASTVCNALWRDKAEKCYKKRLEVNSPWPENN